MNERIDNGYEFMESICTREAASRKTIRSPVTGHHLLAYLAEQSGTSLLGMPRPRPHIPKILARSSASIPYAFHELFPYHETSKIKS